MADLIKQIHAARKYDLDGVIIFDYAHLNESYIDALVESVFKPTRRDIAKQEEQEIIVEQQVKSNERKKKNGRRK